MVQSGSVLVLSNPTVSDSQSDDKNDHSKVQEMNKEVSESGPYQVEDQSKGS